MSIDITPETERVVREELLSGHFQSVDDLIASGVQAWRKRNLPQDQAGAGGGSATARLNGKDKAREFVEWAKSHPFTPPLSDEAVSRASLNPDRW
jgi:Arc/MetJ-type ribon-helix-helix transcriptional regulator